MFYLKPKFIRLKAVALDEVKMRPAPTACLYYSLQQLLKNSKESCSFVEYCLKVTDKVEKAMTLESAREV